LGFITQVGRTVLRVKDFTWQPGFMVLVEAELEEGLRGEVKLRRVKRHYHERSYGYEMPVTPDALAVARRAATWLLVYMWRRALFAVQYDGMSAAAKQQAWAARERGFSGGMPPGAVISAEEAIARLKAGERSYVRVEFGPGDVRLAGDEPMFVNLGSDMRFTTTELNAERAGEVYSELGEELGVRPHSSGVNSGRRNAAVALSQGLDKEGMGQMMVKKLMQHRTSQGTTTFEAQYDDAPHSVDLGALMMGRRPEAIVALKSLLTTRVQGLAQLRVFSDVPKNDVVRQRVWDGSARRQSLVVAVRDYTEVVRRLSSSDARLSTVRAELATAKADLSGLEGRLRYETKEEARWAMWCAEYDGFDALSSEQLKQRCACADVSKWDLRSLLLHFGCARDQSTLLGVRERRRAVLTDAEQERLLAGGPVARRAAQSTVRSAISRVRGARADRKLVQLKLMLVGSTVCATISRRRQRFGNGSQVSPPARALWAKMRMRVQRGGEISISIGAVRRACSGCSYAE
jgi:hypothetical protein